MVFIAKLYFIDRQEILKISLSEMCHNVYIYAYRESYPIYNIPEVNNLKEDITLLMNDVIPLYFDSMLKFHILYYN